jgi:hypothetical protein
MLDVAGERRDVAGEVRASRAGLEMDALDRQVGMGMKELRQHPLDFDAGCVSLELDPRCAPTSHEVENLALEVRVSGGGFEVGEQLGHLGRGAGGEKISLQTFPK